MRWFWIDRFVEFESGSYAKAIKNVSLAEEHLHDHFPGFPVMPGSLILEGLAQTGGILLGEANNFQEKVVLAKIGNARFHREALAGETLTYSTELIDLRPEGLQALDERRRNVVVVDVELLQPGQGREGQ